MIKILIYIILSGNAIIAIWRPWISVIIGYFFAIFGPQFIWFWAFEGIRPFYYLILPCLIGFGVAVLSGRVNFRVLREPINICVLVLWVFLIISFTFGPYVKVKSAFLWLDADKIFENLSKIFLFYFLAVLLIDDARKLKWVTVPILLTAVYMTYWANSMYLSGNWYGRLGGPSGLHGSTIYSDENSFAMLFVTSLPFVYFLGWSLRSWIARFLVWLIIPFGWHALFLTGSRGGIVGLAVIAFIIAFLSPRKIWGIMLLLALVIAFSWQSGQVMKERAKTIVDYQEDSSAQTRFDAWKAGFSMILAHPFTGVGVSSFVTAFPDFSDKSPRVAHNTFIQVAAEWGLLAGIAFVLVIGLALKTLWHTRSIIARMIKHGMNPNLYLINEAVFTSLIGFFACSLFLSLEAYEIFYYLLVLAGGLGRVIKYEKVDGALKL